MMIKEGTSSSEVPHFVIENKTSLIILERGENFEWMRK